LGTVHPRSAGVIVLLPGELVPAVALADQGDDPMATAMMGQTAVFCSLDLHLSRPKVVACCRVHGIEVMGDVELTQRIRRSGEGLEDRDIGRAWHSDLAAL
jgi:hypothetical protein